jgi:hypothetical protein
MVRKSSMLNRKEDRHRIGGTDMAGGTVEVMAEGTWEAGRDWEGM